MKISPAHGSQLGTCATPVVHLPSAHQIKIRLICNSGRQNMSVGFVVVTTHACRVLSRFLCQSHCEFIFHCAYFWFAFPACTKPHENAGKFHLESHTFCLLFLCNISRPFLVCVFFLCCFLQSRFFIHIFPFSYHLTIYLYNPH